MIFDFIHKNRSLVEEVINSITEVGGYTVVNHIKGKDMFTKIIRIFKYSYVNVTVCSTHGKIYYSIFIPNSGTFLYKSVFERDKLSDLIIELRTVLISLGKGEDKNVAKSKNN